MANLRDKTKDRPKVTVTLIQHLAEALQALKQESLNDGHDSEVTQGSDLEQEDSEISLTEDEEQWIAKTKTLPTKIVEIYEPIKYY